MNAPGHARRVLLTHQGGALGLFGRGEILYNLEERHNKVHAPAKVANVWPSRQDLGQAKGAIGPGAVEGVAAPETANNAAATSSFIPLLTLGIPANATMALMFGALLIQGVQPGPQLVSEHPDLFWGVINSMYIGNILLLIMSIPMVGVFVKILRVRPGILAPITVLITLLGVYTVNNQPFDIFLVIVFGVLGYLMKKLGFEPGPLVLAFVLGTLIESSTRQSLLIFGGDPTGFLTRPISGTVLAVVVLAAALPLVQRAYARRHSGRARHSATDTREKEHTS